MSTHQEVERHNGAAEWEFERLGSLQGLPKHHQYTHYCPVGVKHPAALLDFADTITAGSLWGSLESDKSRKQGSLFNLYWGDGVRSLIHLCCKTSRCWLRIFSLALQSRGLGRLNTSLAFGIHLYLPVGGCTTLAFQLKVYSIEGVKKSHKVPFLSFLYRHSPLFSLCFNLAVFLMAKFFIYP